MFRKTKFGLNLDEIIIEHKKENKEKIIDVDKQVVCEICQESVDEKNIRYVNCKLEGTKFKKIGRYKYCDKTICRNCIERCEEIKVGSDIMFQYTIKKTNRRRTPRRTSFMTVYKSGTVDDIGDGRTIIVNSGISQYELKWEDILYKCNTCPWCRSHQLLHWKFHKEKYPKTKKKFNRNLKTFNT